MRRMVRRGAVAALAAAFLVTPALAQFPDIGGLVNRAQSIKKIGDGLRSITEPEEIKLGGDLAGMMMGAAPLVQDPAKQRYVNRLGRWLALHCERPDLPWKFGIIDSPAFNAFSMPGGYVLITRGLFDKMRTESELAGVLAHEIAHVVRKHHLEALQKQMRDQSFTEMRRYFSVGSSGGIASQFTTILLGAGKEMYIRGLDKEDEFEADRMGVVIAARSGYSPFGLVGVLQTLTGTTDEKAYALHTRTHPLPIDRIDRLDAVMGSKFDGMANLVDDLPSFVALRTPPTLKVVPQGKPKSAPARRGRRRS